MNPAAIDIKDILCAEGIGTFNSKTGWGVFVEVQPEAPITAITIYDKGCVSTNLLDHSVQIQYNTVVVRVRGPNYKTTFEKAQSIVDFLATVTPATWGGSKYLTFSQFDGPTPYMVNALTASNVRDNKQNFMLLIEFMAIREKV